MWFRDLLETIEKNPCRGPGAIAQLLRVERDGVEAALLWLERGGYVRRMAIRGRCANCPIFCQRQAGGWVLTPAGRSFLTKRR
ncbi:MAG: hypothetical protein LBP65_01180 [Puniceicoccales bacterium]|jgi:hypothetical protein|nr:hypothetical protein [Puniceicoccales bacterium]